MKNQKGQEQLEFKQLQTNKLFVTIEEASEYLDLKISTLYSYTHNRTIPFCKPRRKIYFKIEDLDKFVLGNGSYYKSQEQIEAEAIEHLVVTS
ncbi:MAG: helix-turn-helix domain-containing protein [Candidatus Tenebribacter davisii]|jgi:excisionase family DNA binding protein|nr:helix-turn-helix domain-containing protein [Candidatus Tenebribacter davisii]